MLCDHLDAFAPARIELDDETDPRRPRTRVANSSDRTPTATSTSTSTSTSTPTPSPTARSGAQWRGCFGGPAVEPVWFEDTLLVGSASRRRPECGPGQRLTMVGPLPGNLPAPGDDGAADHLPGRLVPPTELTSTDGATVHLGPDRTVLYCYPLTGRADVDLPDGWDSIPGARGCTNEACDFRNHHADLLAAGAAAVTSATGPTRSTRPGRSWLRRSALVPGLYPRGRNDDRPAHGDDHA